MKRPAVHILASQRNGTLYIGVTASLVRRIWQHSESTSAGFTKKYQIYRLVYFEFHVDFLTAIARESAIKKWRRLWKIRLIEQFNPTWEDLYDILVQFGSYYEK